MVKDKQILCGTVHGPSTNAFIFCYLQHNTLTNIL